MKERPILFNGPMVRAIIDGRKTQTRRVVKQVQHWEHCGKDIMEWCLSDCYTEEDGTHWLDIQTDVDDNSHVEIFCPYGKPGDRLWVRETWAEVPFPATGPKCKMLPDGRGVTFRADWNGNPSGFKWRPSIHMPRLACRLTLENSRVRVERLQDISEEDAIAEGLACLTKDGSLYKYGIADRDGLPGDDDYGWHWKEWESDARLAYKKLWESINGPGSWDANPWVWVIEFKRINYAS